MREHLGFLNASSAVVKVAAWIFLFLGLIAGSSLLFGAVSVPGSSRWMGLVILAVYVFIAFFFFLVAKISDILVRIINEIKKV